LVRVDSYEVPEGLYYHEEYGWVKIEDGKARIGITDYAQKQLRDVVYIELPSPGDEVTQSEPYGSIESVKAVSDLVAPLSGTIEEVNEEAQNKPELVNEDPYGKGWLILIKPTNLEEELKNLMDTQRAAEWHKSLIQKG